VVWQTDGPFGFGDIQGQRYASNGAAQAGAFQVNTSTTYGQIYPVVAAEVNGDFVVVWNRVLSDAYFVGPRDVQGRRYASNGTAQSGEFQVNTNPFEDYYYIELGPSVAADDDGDFVVVWSGDFAPGVSIQGQRFASNGTAVGSEFQINTYSTNLQLNPSVAAAAGGDFVVAWDSYGSSGTDTIYWSIQGQRFFAGPPTLKTFAISGTSDAVAWSWRIAFGGNTVASATNVGPVMNGGGPALFATAFINSINSNPGSAACTAAATGNPAWFSIDCPNPFDFFVADASGTGGECMVTGTLGGSGCAFNPTIVELGPQVPALSAPARLALVAVLMLLAAVILKRRP
jgi:hypothetical protein